MARVLPHLIVLLLLVPTVLGSWTATAGHTDTPPSETELDNLEPENVADSDTQVRLASLAGTQGFRRPESEDGSTYEPEDQPGILALNPSGESAVHSLADPFDMTVDFRNSLGVGDAPGPDGRCSATTTDLRAWTASTSSSAFDSTSGLNDQGSPEVTVSNIDLNPLEWGTGAAIAGGAEDLNGFETIDISLTTKEACRPAAGANLPHSTFDWTVEDVRIDRTPPKFTASLTPFNAGADGIARIGEQVRFDLTMSDLDFDTQCHGGIAGSTAYLFDVPINRVTGAAESTRTSFVTDDSFSATPMAPCDMSLDETLAQYTFTVPDQAGTAILLYDYDLASGPHGERVRQGTTLTELWNGTSALSESAAKVKVTDERGNVAFSQWSSIPKVDAVKPKLLVPDIATTSPAGGTPRIQLKWYAANAPTCATTPAKCIAPDVTHFGLQYAITPAGGAQGGWVDVKLEAGEGVKTTDAGLIDDDAGVVWIDLANAPRTAFAQPYTFTVRISDATSGATVLARLVTKDDAGNFQVVGDAQATSAVPLDAAAPQVTDIHRGIFYNTRYFFGPELNNDDADVFESYMVVVQDDSQLCDLVAGGAVPDCPSTASTGTVWATILTSDGLKGWKQASAGLVTCTALCTHPTDQGDFKIPAIAHANPTPVTGSPGIYTQAWRINLHSCTTSPTSNCLPPGDYDLKVFVKDASQTGSKSVFRLFRDTKAPAVESGTALVFPAGTATPDVPQGSHVTAKVAVVDDGAGIRNIRFAFVPAATTTPRHDLAVPTVWSSAPPPGWASGGAPHPAVACMEPPHLPVSNPLKTRANGGPEPGTAFARIHPTVATGGPTTAGGALRGDLSPACDLATASGGLAAHEVLRADYWYKCYTTGCTTTDFRSGTERTTAPGVAPTTANRNFEVPQVNISTEGVPFGQYRINVQVVDWAGRQQNTTLTQVFNVVPRAVAIDGVFADGKVSLKVLAGFADDHAGTACTTDDDYTLQADVSGNGWAPVATRVCQPASVTVDYLPANQQDVEANYRPIRTIQDPTPRLFPVAADPIDPLYTRYRIGDADDMLPKATDPTSASTVPTTSVPHWWRYVLDPIALADGAPPLPDPPEVRVTVRATTTYTGTTVPVDTQGIYRFKVPLSTSGPITTLEMTPIAPLSSWTDSRDVTFFEAPGSTRPSSQAADIIWKVRFQRAGVETRFVNFTYEIYAGNCLAGGAFDCGAAGAADDANFLRQRMAGHPDGYDANRQYYTGFVFTAHTNVSDSPSILNPPTVDDDGDAKSWRDSRYVNLTSGTYTLRAIARSCSTGAPKPCAAPGQELAEPFERVFYVTDTAPTIDVAFDPATTFDDPDTGRKWVSRDVRLDVTVDRGSFGRIERSNITSAATLAQATTLQWVPGISTSVGAPTDVPGQPTQQLFPVRVTLPAYSHATTLRLYVNVTPPAIPVGGSARAVGIHDGFVDLDLRAPTLRLDMMNVTAGGMPVCDPDETVTTDPDYCDNDAERARRLLDPVDGALLFHGIADDAFGSGVAACTSACRNVEFSVEYVPEGTFWNADRGRFVPTIGGPFWNPVSTYDPDPDVLAWAYTGDAALAAEIGDVLGDEDQESGTLADFRVWLRARDRIGNTVGPVSGALVVDAKAPQFPPNKNFSEPSSGGPHAAYGEYTFATWVHDGSEAFGTDEVFLPQVDLWVLAPDNRLHAYRMEPSGVCASLPGMAAPTSPAGSRCYAVVFDDDNFDELGWAGDYEYYFSARDRFGNLGCSYGACVGAGDPALGRFTLVDNGAPVLGAEIPEDRVAALPRGDRDGRFFDPPMVAAGGFANFVVNIHEASNFSAGYPRAFFLDGDRTIGNVTMVPYNGTSVDPVAGFGLWAANSLAAGIDLVANRTYCVVVVAIDRDGNEARTAEEPDDCEDDFRVVDNVPPIVTVPTLPTHVGRNATVEVRVDDVNMGPRGLGASVRVDQGAARDDSVNVSAGTPIRLLGRTVGYTFTYRGGDFPDGANVSFTFTARDNASATNATTFTARVDARPPSVTADVQPTVPVGGTTYVGPGSTITLTATDTITPAAQVRLVYRVNGGSEQAYAAPFQVTGGTEFRLDYAAIDGAGNRANGTLVYAIDRTAPVVTVVSSGGNTTITATDDLVGVDPERVTLYYKTSATAADFVGFPFDLVTGNTYSAQVGALAGAFVYYIDVADRVGNVGHPTVNGVTCTEETPCGLSGTDVELPEIAIVEPAAGATLTGQVTVRWTASVHSGRTPNIRIELANTTDRVLVREGLTTLDGSHTFNADALTLPSGDWRLVVTVDDGVNPAQSAERAVVLQRGGADLIPEQLSEVQRIQAGQAFTKDVPVAEGVARVKVGVYIGQRLVRETTVDVGPDGTFPLSFRESAPGIYQVRLTPIRADGSQGAQEPYGVFTVLASQVTEPKERGLVQPIALVVVGALVVALAAVGAFRRWPK